MVLKYLPVFIVIIAGAYFALKAGKLTLPAAVTGELVAMIIYCGAGYTGVGMLALFFILGTLATSWQKELKQNAKARQTDSPQRTAFQVLANAGVAAVCGVQAFLVPQQQALYCLMLAASLAAATADTLSSELGMVYGRRFFNILTFRKEEKGLDGVISLEGTLIGAAGALLIAIVYSIGFGFDKNCSIIVIAGIIGNLADSILGAALERRGYLKNDMVNLLNTLIGALVAGVFVIL